MRGQWFCWDGEIWNNRTVSILTVKSYVHLSPLRAPVDVTAIGHDVIDERVQVGVVALQSLAGGDRVVRPVGDSPAADIEISLNPGSPVGRRVTDRGRSLPQSLSDGSFVQFLHLTAELNVESLDAQFVLLFVPPLIELGIDRTRRGYDVRGAGHRREHGGTARQGIAGKPEHVLLGDDEELGFAIGGMVPITDVGDAGLVRQVPEFGQIAQLLARAKHHQPDALGDDRLQDIVTVGEHFPHGVVGLEQRLITRAGRSDDGKLASQRELGVIGVDVETVGWGNDARLAAQRDIAPVIGRLQVESDADQLIPLGIVVLEFLARADGTVVPVVDAVAVEVTLANLGPVFGRIGRCVSILP